MKQYQQQVWSDLCVIGVYLVIVQEIKNRPLSQDFVL